MNAAGPTEGKIRRLSDGEKPERIAFIQLARARREGVTCIIENSKNIHQASYFSPPFRCFLVQHSNKSNGLWTPYFFDVTRRMAVKVDG